MVLYCSTRGVEKRNFQEVLLEGLAPDGGLYAPLALPEVSIPETGKTYPEVLTHVLFPFLCDWVTREELETMVSRAFQNFQDPAIAVVKKVEEGQYLLDLTHGPTLAFKDFALQMLGQMLDFELSKQNRSVMVIGATSGDTGSAAIEALRQSDFVKTAMLHPAGRVSDVQRRQMTTVCSDTVLNLAVGGSFDDCQQLIKAAFVDESLREKLQLTAVNSINWARVLVQISYYFYAYALSGEKRLSFAVPTGNFGNVLAGWYAKQLGLPIEKFFVATNRNDAFTAFLESGCLVSGVVEPSFSPSMDIQIPSNLERLLWEVSGKDSTAVADLLEEFRSAGRVAVPDAWMESIRQDFVSHSVSDEETLEEIRRVHETSGLVIDPHTAVGTKVASAYCSSAFPIVTLETAAAAKFPAAIEEALGVFPSLPEHMADLHEREEKFENLDASFESFADRLLNF